MNREIVQSKTINLVIDSVIMALSIIFIISTFIEIKKSKKIRNSFLKIFISEFIYALIHMLAIYYKGIEGGFASFIVRTANFLEYSFIFVIFVFFVDYVFLDINNEKMKKGKILLYCFSTIGIVVNIVNLFIPFIYSIDSSNIYQRGPFFWLPSLIMLIYCIMMILFIVFNRKHYSVRILISFLGGTILPISGALIQYFIYGYSFVIIGIFISTIFIFFSMLINEAQKAKEKENELIKINNRIMLNQMNPHFLFNALTTITCLCDEDPKEAKEALHDFSFYLRNNLDSIASYELIPFEKELEHIKAYLRIENRRFGNKISLEENISCTDFKIPPLSIESLVENSVKHGFFDKDSGTITLTAKKNEDHIVVEIIDDGVGFDTKEILRTDVEKKVRISYGLQSSIKRFENYLSAKTEIDSEIGKGTRITIFIPVKREDKCK